MRYSQLYAIKAQKAVETGLIDINALIEEMLDEGVPEMRINAMLVDDLETEGPIFGKFFRSLGLAGESSISIAESQAANIGEALTVDEEIARFAEETRIATMTLEELAAEGDPEAMHEIENLTDQEELTWVCTLRNTCEQCLPLHGKTLKRSEWRELGFRPRSMHPRCECDWVAAVVAEGREDLVAPLTRQIAPGQEKGGRKTIRAITGDDVARAMDAAKKASESPTGRKILRLLGQAGSKRSKEES